MNHIIRLSLDLGNLQIGEDGIERQDTNRNQLDRLKLIVRRIIIEQLTTRQKEICILYFYQNKNIPQIAELLQVNKSTVSRTLARALKNINEKIKYYKVR